MSMRLGTVNMPLGGEEPSPDDALYAGTIGSAQAHGDLLARSMAGTAALDDVVPNYWRSVEPTQTELERWLVDRLEWARAQGREAATLAGGLHAWVGADPVDLLLPAGHDAARAFVALRRIAGRMHTRKYGVEAAATSWLERFDGKGKTEAAKLVKGHPAWIEYNDLLDDVEADRDHAWFTWKLIEAAAKLAARDEPSIGANPARAQVEEAGL